MADTQLGEFYGTVTRRRVSVKAWTGLLGTMISLGLVVGIAAWGYQLMLRDVNGVPVIKALGGPMRVQPADPGGTRMAHQGLSVNQVAAAGEAGQIADALVLAPDAQGLRDHDLPLAQLPDRASIELSGPGEVLADLTPSESDSDAELIAVAVASAAAELVPASVPLDVIPASVPGPSRSLVPPARPAHLVRIAAAITPAPAAARRAVDIDPDSLPVGARLVQLGAFDSLEKARAEWDNIAARFSTVMSDKSRVIQEASSNGETFYRLRVAGFTDLADARRFCAILTADKTKPLCVPAAVR